MTNQQKAQEEFIDSYSRLLKENAPKSSGALSSSIKGELSADGVDFYMLEYGQIIDKGINGTERNNGSPYSFTSKKPPISSLIGYAVSIGVSPYALQNSIFKKGFKPQPFLEDNSELNKFGDNLAEAVFEDFADKLKDK